MQASDGFLPACLPNLLTSEDGQATEWALTCVTHLKVHVTGLFAYLPGGSPETEHVGSPPWSLGHTDSSAACCLGYHLLPSADSQNKPPVERVCVGLRT